MSLENITKKTFLQRMREDLTLKLMPLVAAGALYFASSCGLKKGECNEDRDCPGDQVCFNNVCSGEGSSCINDNDCPRDLVCSCPTPSFCGSGTCVASNKPPVQIISPDETKTKTRTKVLDNPSSAGLKEVSNKSDYLVFEGNSSYAQNLRDWDIIAIGISDKTPFGLLRRVDDIKKSDSGILVETSQASLEEAIEEGSFQGSIPFSENSQKVGALSNFGQKQAPLSLVDFYFNFDNTDLYKETVFLDGYFYANLGVEFELQIKYFSVQKVSYKIVGNEELFLKLRAEYSQGISQELTPIEPINFAPITVMISGIPVVVVPNLTFTLGLNASGELNVETSVIQSLHTEFGLQYQEKVWSPIEVFEPEFNYIPPSFTIAKGDAEVYIKPKFSLDLYNIGGPYALAKLFGKVKADVSANPWYEVSTGLDVLVGANVEILLMKHYGYEKNIFTLEKTILTAPGGCGDGVCMDLETENNCNGDCCAHYVNKICLEGNVHWVDSCGNVEEAMEDCDNGCSDGKCIVQPTCTSHNKKICSNGDVYWQDSCGNVEEQIEDCDNGCSDGKCIVQPTCASHNKKICSNGDVYWQDSCGNLEEMIENCGSEGCSNGACNKPGCEPLPFANTCYDKMSVGTMDTCGNINKSYNCDSGTICEDGSCIPCIAFGDDGSCIITSFTDVGNGTVIDTNLFWEKTPGSGFVSYTGAENYCQGLTLANYNDWRLPTIDELRSTVSGCPKTHLTGTCGIYESCTAESCLNSACDGCSYKNGPAADGCYMVSPFGGACQTYWSSTMAWDQSYAFVISFSNAKVDSKLKDITNKIQVLCVRDVKK